MEFAAENEGKSGGGLHSVAEGVRPSPEPGREGVRDLAGAKEFGGGEEGKGLTGMKEIDGEEGSGQRPEEIPMDLTVAKQETDSSLVVKEAKVGDPEVKEEKVKDEVMDWSEVKEEKDNLEIKQEKFVGQCIKEEVMHGEGVKEEKDFLKKEIVDDTKVKEEPPINHPVGCKRKLAMSRCETCGTEEAKYRCPRCMRYSCSLPCVKKHKAELTCNGVRDKTAYVSIQQFTEMNLLSDYRFLEDVARTADHISRDAFLKRPISNKHMYFIKNRARRQGINLKLLPNGFTKRKENSTFFDKKKQQFCWHVKLQFPQSRAEYIEKRVPDDKTINEILKPYIDPEKSDPVIRQRLKAYIRSQTGVQILMKIEYMQQNLVRYYELDPYKSLLDNLRNKVIIEYPTLHVVLKGSNNDMKVLHQVKSESTKNLGNEN
ncbi:box C/D snoRNA protein 1 isoform X4 [Symphalangus syndactylus]|uniref:box C/D snoRNA protein 1 isoform X4 n=1 Tax=Symphalangus syndactylus TaxID=9590 RepID=UPI003003EE50